MNYQDFRNENIIDDRQQQDLLQNIRVYVTLRRGEDDQEGDPLKKLILMTPTNIKISMLKRLVEQEYSDLFPNEPTFICAKLQDQYGYSLSNSSYVHEQVKHLDRLFAIPEGLASQIGDGKAMHLSNDPQELLYLLKSIQSNICGKLTECSFNRVVNIEEILAVILPIGFGVSNRPAIHNVSQVLRKIFETERLQIFEQPENIIIFNQLITLLNFWIGDVIFQDAILLSSVVDILEILIKSALISSKLKSVMLINNLMNVSKLDMASAQTRSRIIRIISYLTKGEFRDVYHARPISRNKQDLIRSQPQQIQIQQNRNNFNSNNQNISTNSNILNNNNQLQTQNYVPSQLESNKKTRNLNSRDQFASSLQENQQRRHPSGGLDQFQEQRQLPNKNLNQNNNINNNQKFQNIGEQIAYGGGSNRNSDVYGKQTNINQLNQNQQQFQEQNLQPINNQIKVDDANFIRQNNFDDHTTLQLQMMRDYVTLLVPESSQDMHVFAIQNLEPVISQVINSIMENREYYLNSLNLLEFKIPYDFQQGQMRILESIGKNLNMERALDGIQNQVVQRILRAFNYQPKQFQPVLFDLLQNHLKYGDYQVDVSNIIALVECPYENLQHLGMKIMTVISDPNKTKYFNYDVQFENYIKYLIDFTFDDSKSTEFINLALLTLANLALKDSLRSHIIYNRGIEMFLSHLRNQTNIEGSRTAAKALLNLSISSSEHKMRIVGELDEEIKKMHRNQLDSIIHGYLQTLIISKDNFKRNY